MSTANPNAASTAAAAAFMASSGQNPNRTLSSAAAAAALRARPLTPTNVAEVQTKRTLRRSSSVSSSAGSSGRNTPRLERRGSVSSMTERTFRSPSPHGERASMPPQPPVPSIPVGHRASKSTSSAGAGMQNFRTASQKLADGARTAWHTGPTGEMKSLRTSDTPMNSSARAAERRESTTSTMRSESQASSINFSYPSRLRAASPTLTQAAEKGSPQSNRSAISRGTRSSVNSSSTGKSDQTLVYDPNSRRMVPRAELEAVEYQAREAAEKVPRKKKSSNSVQRLRMRTTGVESAMQSREVQDQARNSMDTPPPTKERSQEVEPLWDDDMSGALQPYEETMPQPLRERSPESQVLASPISPESQEPTIFRGSRLDTGRQPSVVEEESETDSDEMEPEFMPTREAMDALDNVPTRQTLYSADQESGQEPATQSESRPTRYESSWGQRQAQPQPVIRFSTVEGQAVAENKPVAALVRDESLTRRSSSQSPARQARFSAGPAENLVVKHVPLPRSASPMKSAMKQTSSSPREASPSDPNGQGDSPDQEAPLPRKKAVRVSFDERSPVIVGDSAPVSDGRDSPVTTSPQQTRRPWYSSLGRSKKKTSDFSLDDDEVMKPRPALPSFGSVREKKARDSEDQERPLIRPHDPPPTPPSPQKPSSHSPGSNPRSQDARAEPASLGQQSDHATGSVLLQDQTTRNAANISRFREPLPPVVTSVEGGGDFSDSMKSSSDEDELFDVAGDDSDEDAMPDTQNTVATAPESQSNSGGPSTIMPEVLPEPEQQQQQQPVLRHTGDRLHAKETPSIAIIEPADGAWRAGPILAGPPTPRFDVPGMFPDDVSEAASPRFPPQTSGPSPVPSPGSSPIPSPVPSSIDDVMEESMPAFSPSPSPAPAQSDSDDESNESVYSDAYEDFSDADGVGFQSLNAVIDSPVSKSARRDQALEEASGKKARPEEMKPATRQSAAAGAPATSRRESDWEQVKSFWRGLTAEKRRQLEQEAMEDSGADGDEEENQLPPRRLSNRANSRTKKTAEKKQAAKSQATTSGAKTRAPKPTDPERTYMIKPGSKATHEPLSPAKPAAGRMRTSLRGEQPAKASAATNSAPGQVRMRKSMRADNVDDAPQASSPTGRGTSIPTSTSQPAPRAERNSSSLGKKPSFDVPTPTAAALQRPGMPLERRGSDASDSSFKRSRAANADGSNFRKTMRKAPPPQTSSQEPTKGTRFSLRSLSPTHRSNAAAPPVAMAMRRTLREGSVSSQESRRLSWQFPSLGRSSKSSEKKARAGRFDDSTDEDEPAAAFRSRFQDSSDEDDNRPVSPLSKGTLKKSATAPATSPLAKTATAARRGEEEESEELPDSDDDPSMHMPSPFQSPRDDKMHMFRPGAQRTSSGIGTNTLKRSRSGRGSLAPSATAPLTTAGTGKNRSSFMSSILRRNRKADAASKITRAELMDSAARRDTRFERTADELRDARHPSSRAEAGPGSPKLQKRSSATLQRNDGRRNFSSSSAPGIAEDSDDGRPSTAGGRINGNTDVDEPAEMPFPKRRSTSLGLIDTMLPGPEGLAASAATQKKKKFGKLRRMFRLDE